jgi:hypothetical protein
MRRAERMPRLSRRRARVRRDRAWQRRDTGIGFLLMDPIIRRYNQDPRFAAFCRKVGLPVPGEAPARKSP